MLPRPLAYSILQYLVNNSSYNFYSKYVNNDFYQLLLTNRYGLINVDEDEGLQTLTQVYYMLKVLNKLKLYPTVKSFKYLIKYYFSKKALFDCYRTNRLLSITQYYSQKRYIIHTDLVYPTPTLLTTSSPTTKQCEQICSQLKILIEKPTEYVTIDGTKIINFDIDCLLYNHQLVSEDANDELNHAFMHLFSLSHNLILKHFDS